MKPQQHRPFLSSLPTRSHLMRLGAMLITAGTAGAANLYWDTNGTTAGSGTATGGDWEGANWNTTADGTTTIPSLWVGGETAVFSAGTNATGSFTVNVNSTVTAAAILFEEIAAGNNRTFNGSGTINIGGGTITSSAFGAGDPGGNNGTDVNFNVVLAGSGGLTIAAHGNNIANNGGGGGSELRLNANNTFSGGLTITSGLVSWNTDAHLGDPANVITLNGGGSLSTGALHTTGRSWLVGASGGTYRLHGSTTLVHNGSIAHAPGAVNPTLRRTDGGTFRMFGSMSGFTGTWHNGGGTTQAAAANADWSNTDLLLQGGNFTANGTGTATVNSITGTTDVYFDYGTTINVDTGNITLTAGGNWRTNLGSLGKLTSSSGTLTFTSGAASGNLTTSNPSMQIEIGNSGATPVSLVKNNVGSLILAAPNTYTGGTTINAGRVETTNGAAYGTGGVTVNNGGQAYLTRSAPYGNNFTINGNGPTETTSYGALRFATPASITGSLTVASASRISAAGADFGTVAGSLNGTGALEKTGTGTVAITGNAAGYSGPVTISQGTLKIDSALSGSVSVADLAVIAGEGSVGGLTLGTAAGSDIAVNGSTPGALSTTSLTTEGTTFVRLLSHPAVAGTPIPVINYSGLLDLPGTVESSFALAGGDNYRSTPEFTDTGSAITLTIPAGADLVWAGTDVTNPTFWDQNVTANWLNGVTPDTFFAGDNVLFDDTATNKTVAMQGLLSPATVTFNNTADYAINGVAGHGFTGPTRIIKNGTGAVSLQGYSHNYTGTVTINAGSLRANGNEALGFSSGITINNGGQFDIRGMNLANRAGDIKAHYNFTIAGAGPDGLGAITNSDTRSPNEVAGILNLTLSDNASVGGTGGRFDMGRSSNQPVFGAIDGNGFTLTKVGSNIVCLRAPSTDITYVVNAGTLKAEDSDLALGTNTVAVNGGTLQAYGYRTLANDVDFAPGTTLDNDGGGNQVWNGTFNLTGTAADTVNLNARNGAITINGAITGTSNVRLNSNNILYLAGSASNTFSGSTTIASTGQLVLSKTGGAVAVPGDLVFAATGTRALVSATQDNQFGPDSVVRYTGTGDNRFELKGTTQTVAGLDSTGATPGYINIQHSEFAGPPAVDGVSDLIVNVSGSNSFTYSGVLRDQGGRVNLTKSGTGTQSFLGGLIDYTGPTVVTGGRMFITSDDTHTASISIAAGAVYEASITDFGNTFEHTAVGFTLSGAGTYVKSGPANMSMTWSGGGSVAMASGALIEINDGVMRLEYGPQSNWTANLSDLTITGSGALNLWDNNNAGVFVDSLNGNGSIIRTNHAATGNLTVGVDNGSGDFSGSISNAVGKTNLIKTGTGTQTLSGINSYTGNTTVNGGTVVLAATGELRFVVTDTANNQVNGSGAVTLDGSFSIDTSAVTVASGTWTLVDTSSLTAGFDANFSPGFGWTENAGVWTFEDGDKTWTFTESSGELELSTSGGYASWIDGFFPGETDENIIGATADPDHDGIPNAVEMVIGGNPATGMDTALLPTLQLVTDPAGLPVGNYLLFTYRRTDLSVTAGVTAAGEFDTDLVAPWSTAVDGVDGVVVLVDDNYASFVPPATNTDRVRVFVPRGVNSKLFGRLNATVPAP